MVWAAGFYTAGAACLLCYWSFIQFHQLQKSWNRTDCTWGSLTHRLQHIKELYYQNHHIPFLILQRCLLLFSRHSQSMNIRLGITKPVPAVGPSVLFKVLKGQGTWKCMENAGSTPSVTCRSFELYALPSDPHIQHRQFWGTDTPETLCSLTVLPSAMNNQRTTVHRDQEQAWVCSLLIMVPD